MSATTRIAARWLQAADTEWHVGYSLKGGHADYSDSDHANVAAAKAAAKKLAEDPYNVAVFYYERRRDTLEPVGKPVAVVGKAPRLAYNLPVDVESVTRNVYGVVGKMQNEAKRTDNDRLAFYADAVDKAMRTLWRKRAEDRVATRWIDSQA